MPESPYGGRSLTVAQRYCLALEVLTIILEDLDVIGCVWISDEHVGAHKGVVRDPADGNEDYAGVLCVSNIAARHLTEELVAIRLKKMALALRLVEEQ